MNEEDNKEDATKSKTRTNETERRVEKTLLLFLSLPNNSASVYEHVFVFPNEKNTRQTRDLHLREKRRTEMGEDEEERSKTPTASSFATIQTTKTTSFAKKKSNDDSDDGEPLGGSSQQHEQVQHQQIIPEFWTEVSSLTNALLESDLNAKNATHCLSNYVLETLVLPAIHPDVISITRKKEFLVALNVCEVSVATVLSKPHVLKTLLKDDPESVTFLMESANQFAIKAIVVSGKETGSSMLRRSASLSATSQTSGGGIDQEEEAATQFDNVDFRALKRAANLLRATLDGREYAHTWATEVIRDSKVRLAEEKASLVAASTEAKMGEDDEAMTMSTTSSSFTDAAIATVTGEQHQRPRESRDSNRAVKEREAIANAQRKCEKALDEIREEAVAAANVAAERKRFEQSDVAKEKRDAKRDFDNREKVLGSFIGLKKAATSDDDATSVSAGGKEEKKNTPSSSLKTNSNESNREKALARVLLSAKNVGDDGDGNNDKLDLCANILLNAIDSLLKGGVTQEEFPALVALGDAFESFVTKCTGVISSVISEMQFLSMFDNTLNTLSRAHADISRSDSIRARLAKSVALLAPNRETMTNTRLNVILTIFDETMRRHEESHDDDVAMSPDVSAILDMARSIIGAPTDANPFALTFGSTTTDDNSVDGDLPMSLRKCIIDRAIFGSQKVSKRLFRIACGWLARIISEATVTTAEETSDDEQKRLAAEQALEGIFKSSEFVFGLSVHYDPIRNDSSADRTEGSSSSEDDDDEYDLEDFFQAANAKIIFGLLAWHALPAKKRRASALDVCFVRNDYHERRGRNKMKSSKSIAAAHRVASTLAHLVRFFDNPPDFVLKSFKNLAIGTEKLVSVEDEFLWFPWKAQLGDVERVEALQASRTKTKFASDLANLGAHQMCAILADEDNLAQNSNFDQQMANKLKRALGRLTFLLPYDAARIYKSQIGGSFVERKTPLGSLESIDEDEEIVKEPSLESTSGQQQQHSIGSDISRSRGGMTLLHHTRDLVVSSSSASSLVAVMNSTEDPSNKIDVLKIFALGSSLLQGTSVDLNKNRNARNPLVLAGFDEALIALTRSVETNVVVPNVVVWTDLARACETLIARREDAINEYHNAQHESASSSSSSGMIENFCDMVAYAKLPKSIADQAFETYFPKDIFDRYNNDAFFASISEDSWEKFKTETAKNVGARGKNCGLNVNVERYFLDEIADMNSMTLLLERICATTVALCKKQGEIDARLKEGIADISSPMKSTAAASLKRSLDPEMVAARSKLSEVMEKLSRAPMLNGLSKIAVTAADAARPNSVTELERIDIHVSRAFHEALPETLPIALSNIAKDATSSAKKHPLKKERMPESIVTAVIDRVKRATLLVAEKSQKTDTRLAARGHPNVTIFVRAICDTFASFSDETKQYYSAEVMSSICDSIATISKVMPVETRKALASIDELKTVESITMLLDSVKVKRSARLLVDVLEISLESEDDVVSRALRSMPGIIEKGRFDAAAYILKRYLSEDGAVKTPRSTSPSPSKDVIAKKDTRYVEYAAEAVIDSLRSFYLEDDEDNEFKSGAESGIFSTAFKQRGVTDKPRETSSLESFAKLLRLVVKAGKDASRVMSNEASLRRFITSTPKDTHGGVDSDTGTPEPSDSVTHTPTSDDVAEDMEYQTIEEQIARDGEIEHELFEQELLALSNVPMIEQLLRQANLEDVEGGGVPPDASARRELTLEAAFSSLLSEARVAFGNRRSTGGDLQQRGSVNAQTTSSPQGRVVDVPSTGDAKGGETSLNSAKKCSYISQRDYQRQHWYYCYDCNLVDNRGCCSTCAVTCHKGHRLAYSRESKFSCDCGAGQSKRDGVLRPCGCITVNQAKLTKDEWKAEVVGKPSEIIHPDSDSELEDESIAALETSAIEKKLIATWTLPRELSAKLGSALKSARVSDVLERVANNCVDKLGDHESDDDSSEDEDYVRASASKSAKEPNMLSKKNKEKFNMNFGRAMKPGTFDVKAREDFAAQTQAMSQVLPLPRKSCVSASTSGLLAIGEGDKVSILSADELYHSDRLADKCDALLRAKATFEVFNVCFNPSDPSKLAVSGLRDVHVFSLSETAEVINRIAIENIFDEEQEFGALLSVKWVPGCAGTLALCSRDYAKLYDCGGKNALVTPDAPITSITPPIGRNFVDCAFFIDTDGADEKLIFLGLLDNGELHCLSLVGDTTFISLYENTLISTDSFPELTRRNAKFGEPDSPTLSFSPRGKNGVSLHYSQTHDVLIVSYESGDTVVTALERDQDYPDSFKLRAPKVIRDDDCIEEMMMSPLSATSTTGTGSMFDSQPSSAQYSQPSSAQSYATGSSTTFSIRGKGDANKGLAYVGDCAFQRDFRARSIGADPEVPPLSFLTVSRRDMSTRVLTFQNESNFEGVDTQTLLNTNNIDSGPESSTLRGFAGYQPDWDQNHADNRKTMLCLLLEDGSFRVYFYGEDREEEHRRKREEEDEGEEGYDDGEERVYHPESHSSPSAHDSGDVLYFEGCSEVTEKCAIYGEFHAVGDNDEDPVSSVKESLISEDLNSQIQTARANAAAALCLSYPPAARDPKLQSFAGIRVQLNYGSSAEDANCVPKSVEIFKGGRKVSLIDSEHARSNSTVRNANNSDAASGVMGNTRWFDIPLNSKESKLCSEKNGLLTLVFHPSMNAPRGACFKVARVVAYSCPKTHIEQSMKTRAIALRERLSLHVRSRVARATRHKELTSGTEAPSSSSSARKLSAIGFPIVLDETFSAITVYARLEQAAASSASTTPVKVPRRLSFSKLQNQSAAVRVFAADGWFPSSKTKRSAFKAILAKSPEDVSTKDLCAVSIALSTFRMIQKNYEWRRDANWALPDSDIESFARACKYIGRPFVRRPLTMQTCDDHFQKQTLEALRLGLCLTPRVVRDSHGAFDCEEFVPSLVQALIASCEGFANNPPSAKLAQKAADIAAACLKSADENFSRSVALAMLDSFAPRVPNVDFFFDREILNDGGSNDSLRQPVFPISLRDDVDVTTSSSNRNVSRLRRPTLLSGGPSSGFATSENTPSGVGILSNFLAGNMVSGGHRCDMCDESIEGIRWHCEVCDDVDLCSECRDRGGITGALLEQGHRTTHPLARIVQRRNPPPSSDGSAALLNKKKTFVTLTESNKKLIGAIVEDICDPTRAVATKGLSTLLSKDGSEMGFSSRVGKDSKPPKPSVTEANIVSPAHAMFLRTLLKSDSDASVLVAKLLSKGIVVPSILSKPGTMGKNKNVSDRDCRILALSASAAMASSGKDAALAYPDGKDGARDVLEWTKRVVESLLGKIAEFGRSDSLDKCNDNINTKINISVDSQNIDYLREAKEKSKMRSEQRDKLIAALKCALLQAKYARDAVNKSESESTSFDMDADRTTGAEISDISNSTADIQSWTKLIVQSYATSESLRLDIVDSDAHCVARFTEFEFVVDSLARSVDVQNEKFQAIKDAGIIVSACERLSFSLKNRVNNDGTIESENSTTRLVSVPLKRLFEVLSQTPEAFAFSLASMPSVIVAAVKAAARAMPRFPLSAVDQREHACLLFEFAAEYCAESTKKELSGVVDCVIQTTLLGSSKKSARDAAMTCLRAIWKNLKDVGIENERQNIYLVGMARSLTKALSNVACGARIERVSQIVAFALEKDFSIFANEPDVMANIELFCGNARKASEKLRTHPRREMYAKLEALEAQSQSLVAKNTTTAAADDANLLPQPMGTSAHENFVNFLLETDEDFAKHAKWLEIDPNPDDISLAYASTPYRKTPLHLMKGTRAFTANASLTIFSEVYRLKEANINLTPLQTRKSSRWPKSVSIWVVPSIVSASSSILNSSGSAFLSSRQLPRASGSNGADNNIVSSLKSAISWEQPSEPWRFVGNISFKNRQTEGMLTLSIPEDVSAIAIRIDSFHVDMHEKASEMLPCPRCSRHVQDAAHGICRYCRENAYQCRQCRNINYENLTDAFWCNECGCARQDKLDAYITYSEVIGDGSSGIYTEDEATSAMKALEILTVKERDTQNILRQCESTCRSLLSRAAVVDESEILNAEVNKTASAPSTPSRTRKTIGGGTSSTAVPASSTLVSGYVPIGRNNATASEDALAKNGDFEALALRSYKEVAKNARITLSKCQAKRISLHRALESYARRGEGGFIESDSSLHTMHNYYGEETNHFGSLRSYMFAIVPALVSLAREKVFFYAFDSNHVKDALFATSSILPQMAPKFARVLVALAVADANVDTRSWLIKQSSERAKTSSLRPEGGGINFTSSTFETDVDVLSRLARMELVKRNDASGDATVAILQLSETLNPTRNPNHRFVDVAVRAALKLFEQDAIARPGGRRRMDNENIDAISGCVECFVNSRVLEEETVRLASSALIAISKGTEEERLAVLKSLLELLKNTDVVSNDDAAESVYAALEASMCTDWEVKTDSFVFTFADPSQVKLSVRTLTEMLLEVAKYAWHESESLLEQHGLVDPSFGLALKRCAKFVSDKIVSEEDNLRCESLKVSEEDIQAITYAATIARALAAHRAPHAISANITLAKLLDACYGASDVNYPNTSRTSVAGACFELLRSTANANSRSARFSSISHNISDTVQIVLPMGSVLDELKRCALPKPKPKRTCLVRLVKSSTQEEFIRGHMSPSPYDVAEQVPVGDNEGDNNAASSDIANAGAGVDADDDATFGDEAQLESTPTFRDVKNFICAQLDLVGLIEDDFGMELLSCGNKIISLDLKVVDVYEKVWVPMQQNQLNDGSPPSRLIGTNRIPPMSITYRLSGLDGEATEDRIDSVAATVDKDDPEVRYESTSCLRFKGGLSALVALVPTISRAARMKPTAFETTSNSNNNASLFLKELCVSREDVAFVRKLNDNADVLALLQAACELKENRIAMLDDNALPHLLREAARAFEAREDTLANDILKVVDRLLAEEQSKATSEQSSILISNDSSSQQTMLMHGGSVDDSASLDLSVTVDTSLAARPVTPPPRTSTPSIINLASSAALGGSGIDLYFSDAESMHEEDKSLFDAASVSRSFLDKLKRCIEDGEPKRCDVLARVLPRLACADVTATTHLVKFSVDALNTLKFDGQQRGNDGEVVFGAQNDPTCDLLALESVVKIVRCAPHDDFGRSFREYLAVPAIPIIRSYIVDIVVNDLKRTSEAFEKAMVNYKALPLALKILEAMSRECEKVATSAAHALNLLVTLHTLENVVVPRGLGTLAENALETIENASNTAQIEIEKMREKTKEEKRELAKRKREQMLREMKMKTQQSERGVPAGDEESTVLKAEVSDALKSQMEEDAAFDDDAGALRCRVCFESINENPEETLGLYCFCTPVSIPPTSVKFTREEDATNAANFVIEEDDDDDDDDEGMANDADGDIIEIIDMRGNQAGTSGSSLASALFGGRGFRGRNRAAASVDPKVDATRGCSTVSHFNAIHISCHLEAKRADINRRPPKREWEGATLRNAETLCNSVLPVWTSSDLRSSNVERTSTSDEEYEERRRRYGLAVDAWWDNVGRAMPMNRQSFAMRHDRFRVSTFDCVILLGRFATNSSFSVESRGGGRESNASLLPQLLRLMQFHGEYVFDASANPSTMTDPSASPLRRQSSSPVPLSVGKKRDIAQREEWLRLANALVDEDYGGDELAFFDACFDIEAFESDMYAILLFAAMTFTKEKWESSIKIFIRRATAFALRCGDDGLRGAFTSSAYAQQLRSTSTMSSNSGGVMSPPETDTDEPISINTSSQPIVLAAKPTLKYLAMCDEINAWLRKDSPEVFYTPGLSVSLQHLSRALLDEADPSIRDHIRRSEALALDQQSRDQFGNMESCSHLSKRTLEVVTVMDAEEDVTNLSKIGGRNVTVNDIIEKGMA